MNKKLKIITKLATIYIEETYPTEGKYPEIVEHLYQYRKTGTFSGNNVVAIADMCEAMWWNRPLLEDTKAAWGIHTDGLPCCNVPTVFATDRTWKNKYNILINKNNVKKHNYCSHLKISNPSESAINKCIDILNIKTQ